MLRFSPKAVFLASLSAVWTLVFPAFAADRAYVTGSIAHLEGSVKYRYEGNRVYCEVVEGETEADEKGRFELLFHTPYPRVVSIEIGGKEIDVFIAPGNSIHIRADARDFWNTMESNGDFFIKHRRTFGGYPKLDYENLGFPEFQSRIDRRRQDRLEHLAQAREAYQLSPDFVDYMLPDIHYEWAFLMVSYPMNYRSANGARSEWVGEDYYDFVKDVDLVNSAAIGQSNYRTFLERYLNSIVMPRIQRDFSRIDPKERKTIWAFPYRYEAAKEVLEGEVLYWFLAGEVVRGFQLKGQDAFDAALALHADFLRDNPYEEFREVVSRAKKKSLGFRLGNPAPEFVLADAHGKALSLTDLRSKAVFLDFWATWCSPCIANIPYIKRIKAETEDLDVVFVNISLDQDRQRWLETIQEKAFGGIHLNAEAGWNSAVAKAYSVSSLPSYLLIDKEGLIADHFASVSDVPFITQQIVAFASRRTHKEVVQNQNYTKRNEIKLISDLEYQGEKAPQNLDLYLPLAEKPEGGFPAIIVMHGGGFKGGHKAGQREQQIAQTLSESGYLTISINYTLAPSGREVNRTIPTIVRDCKRAVLWLRDEGLRYGVNPEKIGAIGASAGGWLSLGLGLTDAEKDCELEGEERTDIQAVVNMYGATDWWTESISSDAPPILTLHGSVDEITHVEAAYRLDKAARRVGARHDLVIVRDGRHSLRLLSDKWDYRPDVVQFFDRHLRQ